ncbi:MAG TPA: Calx-beta domain-containing protein [Acidimicrobiia bacterium]
MFVAVAIAVVTGTAIVLLTSSSGGSSGKPLLVTSDVQRRDLRDEVTLQGTLGRVEERTINAASGGSATSPGSTVSKVYSKDGDTIDAGQSVLALDGRDTVAAAGDLPFFRRLDVGAEGSDVEQLKKILAAAGYSPGPIDKLYTEQTRFALAQWQAAHNYPSASPSTQQAVNVSLVQGTGYKLGAQTSAAATIGPPPILSTKPAAAKASTPRIVNAAVRTSVGPAVVCPASPFLTIRATSTGTPKGTAATFVVSTDAVFGSPTPFTVTLTGSAFPGDVIAPVGSFIFPPGVLSTTIQILTTQDNVVEPNKTLGVQLDPDPGGSYCVGNPASATTTIVSNALPQLTLTGTTTVQQGQSATLTVTADQAPVHDTQVVLTIGGTATPDVDYVSFSPTITLFAGRTSGSLTITTKARSVVEPDKRIVATIAPSATSYRVGPVSTATIAIVGDHSVPTVTITTSTGRVKEGTPAQFVISLDRALSEQLQVYLNFGGDAAEGNNYNPPGGLLVFPPNQTALQVVVPTLDNNAVEPDRLLVAALTPDSAYAIGSPNAAAAVIENVDLPEINIVGGPAQISKGGAVTFTVVADQPPIKDTTVQYQMTGSVKPGQDIVPLTGTVLLRAGQTTADIPVLTLNADVYFSPTDIVTGTWPTRIGQVMVKQGDITVAGKPLFSLTETGFTVTLKASAADRTKLKVGQSTTVQLAGGTDTAPGVISELDEAATTDTTTKTQTYQGKVQVQGKLGAADGAPVTIKVVLEERLNALTVPIAAVKQNGQGQDVVRVIDLAHGGQVHEVKVRTGLSEGSYIEIRSGLKGNEVVVVELNKAPA